MGDEENDRLAISISSWNELKSIDTATDLLARIKLSNKEELPEFQEVCSYLSSTDKEVSETVLNLLDPRFRTIDKSALYTTSTVDIFKIIHELKLLTRRYPSDALTLCDLAFYYSIVGQDEIALKCLKQSSYLAPQHPFVARSHSRFLWHIGDVDGALHVLNKTKIVKSHPMLLSAYLSMRSQANLKISGVRAARELVENFSGSPLYTSELAACIATLEIENGAIKKGKKALEMSLTSPTENTISQCSWLSQKHKIEVNPSSVIRSIEAESTEAYLASDFSKCRDILMELHAFQPFSEDAILSAGSLSLSALNDPEFVFQVTQERLRYKSISFSETNNLVVAKLMAGRIQEASFLLEKMSRFGDATDRERGVYAATLGMYAFALKDYISGQRLYEAAIEYFHRTRQFATKARALHFYSRCLAEIDYEKAELIYAESYKLAKERNMRDLIISERFDPETMKWGEDFSSQKAEKIEKTVFNELQTNIFALLDSESV